jgi:RNA polymerase sigma factor (sigma-70 family)
VTSDGQSPLKIPPEVSSLLDAVDEEAFEAAWERFLKCYSNLLLHTVHSRSDGYDSAMDRYAFILEGLRGNGCQRLRRYEADGRGRFTTWLVVVARRLCEDFRRKRYGRVALGADGKGSKSGPNVVRQRLADFMVEELDPELTPARSDGNPELDLRRQELEAALSVAFATLTPQDQVLLKLRFEDGLGGREVARVVGLPTAFHAYRRIQSCLKDLRKQLTARGIDGPGL